MLDRALDIESCVREAEEATSSSSSSVNDSFTPSDIPIANCSPEFYFLFAGTFILRFDTRMSDLFKMETEHLYLRPPIRTACQLLSVLSSSAFSHTGLRCYSLPWQAQGITARAGEADRQAAKAHC